MHDREKTWITKTLLLAQSLGRAKFNDIQEVDIDALYDPLLTYAENKQNFEDLYIIQDIQYSKTAEAEYREEAEAEEKSYYAKLKERVGIDKELAVIYDKLEYNDRVWLMALIDELKELGQEKYVSI